MLTDIEAMMRERDNARAVVEGEIADLRADGFPAFVSIMQSAVGSDGYGNVFDVRCEHCDEIALEKSGSSIEAFVVEHSACPKPAVHEVRG